MKIMFLKRCLLEILVAEFNSFYSLDNSNKNYGMFRNTRKQLKIFFITKNTGLVCRKETLMLSSMTGGKNSVLSIKWCCLLRTQIIFPLKTTMPCLCKVSLKNIISLTTSYIISIGSKSYEVFFINMTLEGTKTVWFPHIPQF